MASSGVVCVEKGGGREGGREGGRKGGREGGLSSRKKHKMK